MLLIIFNNRRFAIPLHIFYFLHRCEILLSVNNEESFLYSQKYALIKYNFYPHSRFFFSSVYQYFIYLNRQVFVIRKLAIFALPFK